MMLVTAVLVLAAVRWFHMCSPYDRKPAYYYPGRPYMTAAFLMAVLLIPYIVHPSGTDTWLLVRVYFFPFICFIATWVILGYFANVMQRKRWTWPVIAVGIPVISALLFFFVLAVWPGEQIARPRLAGLIIDLLGAGTTVMCLVALWKVRKWADRFDEDDYSNPVDFPVRFARRVILITLISLALLCAGAIADNRFFMCLVQLLLTIGFTLVLIASLHPNRHREFEEFDKPSAASGDGHANEILAAVRKVVEADEAFLEPHLTLNDVATRSGYNRTYVASVIKSHFGGFFKYVNTLRLTYAEEYRQKHPNASIAEIVSESGFGSRQTYYNVKERLGITPPPSSR